MPTKTNEEKIDEQKEIFEAIARHFGQPEVKYDKSLFPAIEKSLFSLFLAAKMSSQLADKLNELMKQANNETEAFKRGDEEVHYDSKA